MRQVVLRQLGGLGISETTVAYDEKEVQTVAHFKAFVSHELNVPDARLRLIFKGKPIKNYTDLPKFEENDVVSYAIALRAPDQYLREKVDGGFEEQEERDLRFDIEALDSRWQQKLACFMKDTLKFSDALLSVLFAISPRGYVMILVWFLLGKVAHRYEFGPIYLVSSIIAFIFMNLGERREGEVSAYSIFNNFQRLPGQLTNEQLERQMIRGQLT